MQTQNSVNSQNKILKFVKKYIKTAEKYGINTANSSICYFVNGSRSVGKATIRLYLNPKKNFLYFVKEIFFHILSIATLINYKIKKSNFNQNEFDKIIITNANEKNFLNNGSYYDPYLRINSRKIKKTLWVLNVVDNFVPKANDKNLIIFYKKKSFFKINLYFFFSKFLKSILTCKFSLKKMFHEFSYLSQFSNIFYEKIIKNTSLSNIKKIIFVYEAQPFQNNFIYQIKKDFKNRIETIGYYHTALHPLPTALVYRKGAPDKLLISGKYQKNYLVSNLNWPNKNIQVVPSFRFSKNNLDIMKGLIFLPYDFFSIKKIIFEFENFLKLRLNKSLNYLRIRNHPQKIFSNKHKILIEEIKLLLKKYKNKFSKKNNDNISIFIGSTSSIILALERGIKVIHICEDPVLDSYRSNRWVGINTVEVNSYVFEYKLKKKKQYLNFSNKIISTEKYLI